jgi:acyl-CoA thioester hydrolase
VGVFATEVRPRWSDMDPYGHVNHANTVTLLEEARIALLFGEAARHGAGDLARGVVVARLVVDYRAPLVVDGGVVRVEIAVRELRSASFTLDYTLYGGPSAEFPTVATAETLMAPYDLAAGRPRRLSDAERDFLAGWRALGPTARETELAGGPFTTGRDGGPSGPSERSVPRETRPNLPPTQRDAM